MINGNAREFIDGLYYGDERFFLHNGNKYFIQGYFKDGKYILEMYIFDTDNDFRWQAVSASGDYPVEEFESAKVFCGKTFGKWKGKQNGWTVKTCPGKIPQYGGLGDAISKI